MQFCTPKMGQEIKIKHELVVWEVYGEIQIELELRPKKSILLSVQDTLLQDEMQKLRNNVYRLQIVFFACLMKIRILLLQLYYHYYSLRQEKKSPLCSCHLVYGVSAQVCFLSIFITENIIWD